MGLDAPTMWALYIRHRAFPSHATALRWKNNGPIVLNVERSNATHLRSRGKSKDLVPLDSLRSFRVKRVVGHINDLDLREFGFGPGPHESSGYAIVSFDTMEPDVLLLGNVDAKKEELYVISYGYVVTVSAQPLTKLLSGP